LIKNSFGIKDSEFIRGDVPMTKEEVRVISISKLGLAIDDTVLDIGAGTGSISIECARVIEGQVYAIERNPSATELLQLLRGKFMQLKEILQQLNCYIGTKKNLVFTTFR